MPHCSAYEGSKTSSQEKGIVVDWFHFPLEKPAIVRQWSVDAQLKTSEEFDMSYFVGKMSPLTRL